MRHRDASQAVADGIAFTGRVISAAAAIMVCVFLSFMLGDERSIKEFGFGLAAAVFLDALVVRCVLLPAVLELLGPVTWRLPRWLDARLPHIKHRGQRRRPRSPSRSAPVAPPPPDAHRPRPDQWAGGEVAPRNGASRSPRATYIFGEGSANRVEVRCVHLVGGVRRRAASPG